MKCMKWWCDNGSVPLFRHWNIISRQRRQVTDVLCLCQWFQYPLGLRHCCLGDKEEHLACIFKICYNSNIRLSFGDPAPLPNVPKTTETKTGGRTEKSHSQKTIYLINTYSMLNAALKWRVHTTWWSATTGLYEVPGCGASTAGSSDGFLW